VTPDLDGLFQDHHLTDYRYLLRMTGRREEAEDLTQEVFGRAVRGIGTYEARGRRLRWSPGARVAAPVASLLVATMAGVRAGSTLGARPPDAGPPTPSRVIRLSADQSWLPVESSESRQP
jgi:hypothetical protein